MTKIDVSLEKSIDFLLSPLVIDDSNTIARGGFYGLQNTKDPIRKTDKPFIFYEITGYGINLLLKLNNWLNGPKFLQFAKNAAMCILKAQVMSSNPKTNGAIYDRYYPVSNKFFHNFHVYPNAVCVGGLCEIFQRTQEKKYQNAAISIKDWLFRMLLKENNSCIGFQEFYSDSEKPLKVFPYESICIPYILLKFQKELELSQKQIEQLKESVSWGIKSQTNQGYFPFFYLNRKSEFNLTAYSHFTIYPLYNLMGFPLAELDELGCPNCFESFKKCGEWMIKVQDKNGGFFTYYFENEHVWHQQSPAVGQALCTFSFLYEKTGEKKFYDAAEKAATWLTNNQISDNKFEGGFYWIYPNKKISKFQKKVMYAKERFRNKLTEKNDISDVTVLFDKVPIWPIQFAIEGLWRFSKIK